MDCFSFCVVTLKLSPSEFWQLSVTEYWYLLQEFIRVNSRNEVDEELKEIVKKAPKELKL